MRRHELTDFEWKVIEPLLPNKPRGVPRANDRRVLNGILWRFRTGSPWRDIPERYGPSTTCYNRFVRWREAGVWDRILDAVSTAYDGDLIMIDSSCVRVHQHGASGKKGVEMVAWDVPVAAWAPRSMPWWMPKGGRSASPLPQGRRMTAQRPQNYWPT
jgi:transposase